MHQKPHMYPFSSQEEPISTCSSLSSDQVKFRFEFTAGSFSNSEECLDFAEKRMMTKDHIRLHEAPVE